MGMTRRTSLLVDRSPGSEAQQKARLTLDDGTVIDVSGHTTYWNPRLIVTDIDAQGSSLEALNLWIFEQEVNNHKRLLDGWRSFIEDHPRTHLLDDWLKDQIKQAIEEETFVLRVCSQGAGDNTIHEAETLIVYELFGYAQVALGTVTDIKMLT